MESKSDCHVNRLQRQKGHTIKYFESHISCIYGKIEKMKSDVAVLGLKFGAKVVENKNFEKESAVNTYEAIQKCFQDIYKELFTLQHDIDDLFEMV